MKSRPQKGVMCQKCRHIWRERAVRRCPHPAVRAVYGENICYWCCKGCKYMQMGENIFAIACTYKEGA